jgi:hypothetical protein
LLIFPSDYAIDDPDRGAIHAPCIDHSYFPRMLQDKDSKEVAEFARMLQDQDSKEVA